MLKFSFKNCVDLRTETHTEPVPLKYGKLAKNVRGYTDIFLQCGDASLLITGGQRQCRSFARRN